MRRQTFYVFKRNGLISYCNGEPNDLGVYGERESTIPLRRFSPDDGEAYTSYLKKDFFGHRGVSNLTKTHVDKLIDCFTEGYQNVFMHAGTEETRLLMGSRRIYRELDKRLYFYQGYYNPFSLH